MELLALSLAHWAGSQTKCEWIYSDCKSAITNIGRTKPTSEYYIIDQIFLPPFVCPVGYVKSHQDDDCHFLDLDLKSKGNVLADDVSSRNLRHPNVPLNISRITVRDALACGRRGNVVWGALPDDLRAIPDLLPPHKTAALNRCSRYWKHRNSKSERDYDWTLGHARHAAQAAQLRTRSLRDQASFVRLIHDKYWRGNHHNPEVTACPHCATLPHPDNDFPSVGYSHWLNECSDPKVVNIRHLRDSTLTNIVESTQAPLRYILNGFATILRKDPLAFMGRFSQSSQDDLQELFANLPLLAPTELSLFTAMSSAAIEAGRSLQAIATPAQEIAWAYVCEARKKSLDKAAQRKKNLKPIKDARRKAKKAAAAILREIVQPSQDKLGAGPVTIPPPSHRSIAFYYGNPSGSDSRHDGDRLFGD
jgi:hypothetical protein